MNQTIAVMSRTVNHLVSRSVAGFLADDLRIVTMAWVLMAVVEAYSGDGPEPDARMRRMPLTELRKLAVQGDPVAQTALGSVYIAGQGLPQDRAEAVKWFRLAAVQGNRAA